MEEDKVKRRFILIAVPVTLFLILMGFTYAFFNYTRTGSPNTFRTGRINFLTEQGNALNLIDVFPMSSSEAASANLSSVSIEIMGNTTYSDGEEFEITLVGVNNTINNKKIPINYIATYTAASGEVNGSSSNDYWNARNSKNASIYTLNEEGEVEEGKQVLVGYIKSGSTGVDGVLTIKAYVDASRIAITDTLENTEPASAEYTNGTTTGWVDGRVVLTTAEWEQFQNSQNSISFKIKAESQEGLWVNPQIESCIGCKFVYLEPNNDYVIYTVWNILDKEPTVLDSGLNDNYMDVTSASGRDYFLGFRLNGSNQVVDAYACGVRAGYAFCIGEDPNGKYYQNKKFLQSSKLWNNTCNISYINGDEWLECDPVSGMVDAGARSYGDVYVEDSTHNYAGCDVGYTGAVFCWSA